MKKVQLFSSLVNTEMFTKLMTIRENIHALCQRGKVKVWRDNNKDNILDWEGETDTGDNFGINIHRANTDPEDIATKVDWHSAGCQVIANINDFNRMMGLANTQKTEKKGTHLHIHY